MHIHVKAESTGREREGGKENHKTDTAIHADLAIRPRSTWQCNVSDQITTEQHIS